MTKKSAKASVKISTQAESLSRLPVYMFTHTQSFNFSSVLVNFTLQFGILCKLLSNTDGLLFSFKVFDLCSYVHLTICDSVDIFTYLELKEETNDL